MVKDISCKKQQCEMHLQALDVLLRVALRAVQDADVLLRLQQQSLGFRQALLGCL